MNTRERLERTMAGEATDRVPVALWRHFPGDDQRAADFARSAVDDQRAYHWDFVNLVPSSTFSTTDYGLQDEWQGALDGARTITKRAVTRSLDWTNLRTLDPSRGGIGRQIESIRLVCEALGEDVPVIQTIYSPLAQAQDIAGPETLTHHLRTQPDRLRSGLNVITESTLRAIDAMRRLPLAGIFYVVRHANFNTLSEAEYREFGMAYDLKVLESLPERWWLNVLHLVGDAPMFRALAAYPVEVINWHDRAGEPDLTQGKLMFGGAVCGGIHAWDHLHQGTPSSVRDAARDAMAQTNGRRLILSAGRAVPVTTPLSNLRALRAAVEPAG